MSKTRRKSRNRLTDEQIREEICTRLRLPEKVQYLIGGVLTISFFAVMLRFGVPPAFTDTGGRWALILWIINLVWTMLVAVGWDGISLEDFKRLPKEQQQRLLRSNTIWFYLWKGGYLALVSIFMLLMGLGGLSYYGALAWVGGLVIGGYLLALVLAFVERRRIVRVVVEGWSADTRWGKTMLRLAIIGPAAGASIGSSVGIILVRLHILPEGILLASAGLVLIMAAVMIVPQVIQDFSVAWIHLQNRESKENHIIEEN
jgi:hypothetical protein